jgi:hypothetical protein
MLIESGALAPLTQHVRRERQRRLGRSSTARPFASQVMALTVDQEDRARRAPSFS